MAQLILREDVDHACFLTLNRPDVLNALNVELFMELRGHVTDLASSSTALRCVVLRGNGRAFSAGHDLRDIRKGEVLPEPHFQAKIIESITHLPQPVIAAVHGFCYTGALELALAADLIITTPSTKFADTHSQWGLSPLWGMTQRLPRRVGLAKAKEMMFTSATYSGEEAVRMGLAERCVPDDRFAEETRELVGSITKNSPYTNAIDKRLLRETDGMDLVTGLAHELKHSPGACEDMAERLSAFGKRSKGKGRGE